MFNITRNNFTLRYDIGILEQKLSCNFAGKRGILRFIRWILHVFLQVGEMFKEKKIKVLFWSDIGSNKMVKDAKHLFQMFTYFSFILSVVVNILFCTKLFLKYFQNKKKMAV